MNCIRSLTDGNPACHFIFVVADDNSSDGTKEALEGLKESADIHLLYGDGKLYYSGGMRLAMDYTLSALPHELDYLLMVNDDVEFFEHCIEKLVAQSIEQKDAVIVGATQDAGGRLSYSGIKYTKGIHYEKVPVDRWQEELDTFNANCVLIPYKRFEQTGSIDKMYVHSLGDFDYGIALKKNGCHIHVGKEYVGLCENNSQKGSWTDQELSRRERIKKKESDKGAPMRQWFYFLRKNFGLFTAIKGTVTPYVRIALGK